MNQNSLIEIGSKANVILRFKSKININGKDYEAGEPYLYLKDVNVIVNYTNQDKSGSAVKTIIANSEIKPKSVMIGGISFSRKLAALLACFQSTDIDYNYTIFETVAVDRESGESGESGDTEGYLYLANTLNQLVEWFVYDSYYNKVTGVYDSDSNSISSEDFLSGETYFVSYSSVKTGTKFSLNKPSIPYMSLEIQGVGNIDKKTKNIMMYFDKVSLNSLIQFTFIQNDMINIPLEFHIIDDKYLAGYDNEGKPIYNYNYVIFED